MSRARIWMAAAWCSSSRVSQASVSSSRRSNRFRFFSRKGALLRGRGIAVLAGCWSEAAEESVYHSAGVKQVFERAQGRRSRWREGLCRGGQIGPIRRNQRSAAVGQNKYEKQSTLAMHRSKNAERLPLERMAGTDNDDSFGKVLMMGSVSWFPSIRFLTTNCRRACACGSRTARS